MDRNDTARDGEKLPPGLGVLLAVVLSLILWLPVGILVRHLLH